MAKAPLLSVELNITFDFSESFENSSIKEAICSLLSILGLKEARLKGLKA
jgi:hypothetical protein